MRLKLERWKSPVSELLIVTDAEGVLRALDYADYEERMRRLLTIHYGEYTLESGIAPAPIKKSLEDYFKGNIHALDQITTATNGTDFQKQVWKALRTIPSGQTCSYGQLARQINRPTASRAVGAANGQNPIAIVVPCHRVIGVSGKLTGYAGGVLNKQWLLDHEGKNALLSAQ